MDETLDRIVRWAESNDGVRVVMLVGSRAGNAASVDRLSDYDIILWTRSPSTFLGSWTWIEQFGPILSQLPVRGSESEWPYATRLVLFDDGAKIDFTILPSAQLQRAGQEMELPEALRHGYRTLLDKDRLTASLPPDDYATFRPPSQEEFEAVIREFWWESAYVAKNLWREELLPAKFSLECVMKTQLLRRMLEWEIAATSPGGFTPKAMGRGLKANLPPPLWQMFEATFAGAEIAENWRALDATIALFKVAAATVAQRFGLEYPDRIEAAMTTYLIGIRNTHPGPTTTHLRSH